MSQRVKYCSCGHANDEQKGFCDLCGQEILDAVAVVAKPPKQDVKSEPAAVPVASAVATSPKKVCPLCGTVNGMFAMLCGGAGCGNDLSAVLPSGGIPASDRPLANAAEPTDSPALPRLHLCIGTQKFECRDGDVIGREGTLACHMFSSIGTVSRRHVSLTRRDAQWFVTTLANVRNITQLDGRDVPHGVPQPLTGEHTLKLSTQCEVKFRVETPRLDVQSSA